MKTGVQPECSAAAPYLAGPRMDATPATELLNLKTVADALPPMSVTVPQVVVRLQSEKNFRV